MKKRYLVYCLALLLCPVSFLGAQTPATSAPPSTGFVHTPDGAPIPGATVRLVNPATGQSWVSWTDGNGKFDFPGLSDGQYRIEVEQLGFVSVTREAELSFPPKSSLDLPLRVATLAEVTASANPAPAKVTPSAPAEASAPPAKSGQTPNAPPQTAAVQPGAPAAPRNGPGNRPGQNGPGQNGPGPNGPRRGQPLPPGVVNALRQGMGQGGFQQVDVSGQAGAQDESAGAAAGPLGAASSSDALLMSGTVGRGVAGGGGPDLSGVAGAFGGPGADGAPSGAGNPFGQTGGQGPGAGGMPMGGMAGGPGVMMVQRPPGGGGGGGGRGGQGGGGGRGGAPGGNKPVVFGEGVGALWGAQRIMRQTVNRVRFSFFDTYDNSVWDARPYSITGVESPKLGHYNERFGANIGGPLRIPKIYDGRDRTFFFVNYTHGSAESAVDTFATVPTVPERSGDFSDRSAQLFNPCGNPACTAIISGPRQPLGSVIPQSLQNSASLGLLPFIPLPNLPGFVQNFHQQNNVPVTVDSLNFHVLHTINAKLNFNAGYNFTSSRLDSLTSYPLLGSHSSVRNQNFTFGLVQNWNAHFLQSTSFNWNRSRDRILSHDSFGPNIAGNLGITGISTEPINFGVPLLSFTNFTDASDPVPLLTRSMTYRFTDGITYSRTKHTMRFGFEIRRMENNYQNDPTPRGQFTFTGQLTSQLDASGQPVSGTGLDFADFLLGLPQATNAQFGSTSTYFRNWAYVAYAQDDWRIHPRFTFQYGVRYQVTTPPIELFNALANLDINLIHPAAQVYIPGQTSPFTGVNTRALVRGEYNDWAPRLGIAWEPKLKLKTVVRAGYSIFYNQSIYNQLARSMANQPPFAEAQTRLSSATELLTLQNGFPPQPPADVPNTIAVDPNYRPGYAQLWNVSIETSFKANWILETTYTGTKGTHLDLLRAPNRSTGGNLPPLIPDASSFTYDTYGASSIYHALQVRLQHRFTQGIMFMGLYTFGKSIDNASSIGGGQPVVVQNDQDFAAERGLSSFDIRHQFRGFSVYELPFGERKKWAKKGWKEHLLGNLRLSTVATWQTGNPYTARILGNISGNTGTANNNSVRADQAGNPSFGLCGGNATNFFNRAAFVTPPVGQFGDAARNTIEGPCSFSLNVSLDRQFRFGKDGQYHADLRWDTQNLTNTPNFSGLSTVVNSTTYGRVTAAKSMRTMGVSLRMTF